MIRLTNYETDDGVISLAPANDLSAARAFVRDGAAAIEKRLKPLVNLVLFVRVEFTGKVDRNWEAENGKYHVSVGSVCEALIPAKELEQIRNNIQVTPEQWQEADTDTKATELIRGGFGATFWQQTGNNRGKLEADARRLLREYDSSAVKLDEALQKPQNAAGTTGYQWMAGNFTGPITGMSMKEVVERAANV